MAMNVERQEYFATPIWIRQIDDCEALNAELEQAIYALRDEDPLGTRKSNFMGWQSQPDLPNNPNFKPVLDIVLETSEVVRQDLNIPAEHPFRVLAAWCGINPTGATNNTHVHPNSTISGVYYVRAPKNCGDIRLLDARSAHLMTKQGDVDPDNPLTWEAVSVTPVSGKMVMFPAWMPHNVQPNISREDRVVISFNLIPSRLWGGA
jgi:uncharacterized protein (TIGR02466 family)